MKSKKELETIEKLSKKLIKVMLNDALVHGVVRAGIASGLEYHEILENVILCLVDAKNSTELRFAECLRNCKKPNIIKIENG